jgi:predicted anti-sigma-YlaC factor YlaD
MKCSKAKRKISMLLDGELEKNEEEKLLAHLNVCENCRKEKEVLHSILRSIEPAATITAPPYLYLKVKQRIREQEVKKSLSLPLLRWLRPITVTLGLVVILFLSSVFGNFLGKRIWTEQRAPSINQEFTTTIGFDVFSDNPNESVGYIYNDLLTGGK